MQAKYKMIQMAAAWLPVGGLALTLAVAAADSSMSSASLSAASSGHDWPQLQCNAARTGWSPDQVDPPYELAGYHYPNEMVCNSVQPVVVDNTIYYGTVEGTVFAIDIETGAEKWKQKTGGAVLGSCAVVEGKVVVPCFDGRLYAFNPADGAPAWECRTPWHIWGAPAVADGLIYAGGMDGVLYAINPADGRQVWALDVGAPIAQAPAADEKIVVVGAEDMRVSAADAKTGRLLWRSVPLAGGESFHNVWPVLHAGRIYMVVTPAHNRYVCGSPYLEEVVIPTTERLAIKDTINTPLDERPYLQAARAYFEKYPERRVSFVLDAATGAQPYVLPFPWWGGCSGPPSPPAINENDGQAYTFYVLMTAGAVSGVLFFGKADMATGHITPFNELKGIAPRQSAKPGGSGGLACYMPVGATNEQDYIKYLDPTWKQKSLFHGGFWAADQPHSLSFGGNKMYVLHHQNYFELNYYDTITGEHAYIYSGDGQKGTPRIFWHRPLPPFGKTLWPEQPMRDAVASADAQWNPCGNLGITYWAPPAVHGRFLVMLHANTLIVYAGKTAGADKK